MQFHGVKGGSGLEKLNEAQLGHKEQINKISIKITSHFSSISIEIHLLEMKTERSKTPLTETPFT